MALQTIYALFQNVADAERAIGALQDHGVPSANIGVATRRPAEEDEVGRIHTGFTRLTDNQGVRLGEPEVAYVPQPGTLPPAALAGTAAPTSAVDTPLNVATVGKEGITTTTPEDAAAGAAVGGGVGLVAGLLAAAAALTIPGFGLVLGGGVLAAAFGATVATTAAGAAVGGVTGYLRDMGMSEHAASSVNDRLREGDYLLTASVDPVRYDEIKMLLQKYNAVGVDINVSAAGEQFTGVGGGVPLTAQPGVPTPSWEAPIAASTHAVGETPDEAMAREEAARAGGARTYGSETRDTLI